MSISLKNKIVFITGASSGIGASCANYFAAAGAKLLLCARRIDVLHAMAAELQRQYAIDVHTFTLDVRDKKAVTHALNALPASWKDIDILVNNAGLGLGLEFIQDGTIDDWDNMIDTNIKGLLYITRNILPNMVSRDSGHIINLGSIAGHEVYPRGAVYCATKHAVNALSRGLRLDLFGSNIRVSTIDPGAVETNFSVVRFKGDTQRAASVYQDMNPLTPDDIADAVLYCATRPLHVNVSEVIIMPTNQACATMIARKAKNESI